MPLSQSELAYTAGVIDGEGCICIKRVGKQLQCRVTVSNCAPAMIYWLDRKFDGCFWTQVVNRKTKLWTFEFKVSVLKQMLKSVLPYSTIKKEQIRIALAFLKTISHSNEKVTPRKVMIREGLKSYLHFVKRRYHAPV